MRRQKRCGRHKERLGGEARAVDPPGVVDEGLEPLLADIGTDFLHHLTGRQGLAKHLDGTLQPGRADHVALRGEHVPQCLQPLAASGGGEVDLVNHRAGRAVHAGGGRGWRKVTGLVSLWTQYRIARCDARRP